MPPEHLPDWENLVKRVDLAKQREVKIALVGKYTGLSDSYLSVLKAIHHAAIEIGVKDVVVWIDSAKLEPQAQEETPEEFEKSWKDLKSCDGILIPGGFGGRGVEGKILAANYARTNKVPFLGICLGLQVAVAEFCRNVVGWKGANSQEFDQHTDHPVVIYMPEVPLGQMGGTMRLGSRCTKVKKGTMAFELYSKHEEIYERHRHRYEVNPELISAIEEKGLIFSGKDIREARMEIIELPADQHPFYFATQFHPEFQSRPMSPSPPFMGLLQASSRLVLNIADDQKSELSPNGAAEPRSAPYLGTGKPKRRSVQSRALTPPAIMNEEKRGPPSSFPKH
jgi:CTP synthase